MRSSARSDNLPSTKYIARYRTIRFGTRSRASLRRAALGGQASNQALLSLIGFDDMTGEKKKNQTMCASERSRYCVDAEGVASLDVGNLKIGDLLDSTSRS